MITTADAELAERVRTLRFHGSRDKVTYEQVGYNSRLDELQAAILRVQLPHLDALADGRRRAGRHYEQAGLGELVDAAAAGRRRLARRGTCTSSRTRASSARSRAGGGRASATRPTTAPRPPPGGDARVGRGRSSCPRPSTPPRTHLAIPMSPVLTREQAEEVVRGCRASAA